LSSLPAGGGVWHHLSSVTGGQDQSQDPVYYAPWCHEADVRLVSFLLPPLNPSVWSTSRSS